LKHDDGRTLRGYGDAAGDVRVVRPSTPYVVDRRWDEVTAMHVVPAVLGRRRAPAARRVLSPTDRRRLRRPSKFS
jgi:hypothetical protein